MAWTPLTDRWSNVPEVLAGPILRRVEQDLVTVWVVTKSHHRVTLRVEDAARNVVMTGTRATVWLGPGCHLVVVTARPASQNAPTLQPGRLYHYNVVFDDTFHLKTPGYVAPNYARPGELVSALGYGAEDALPSFSLPPTDPANLRIIHGSCRRAQGDERDALEGLDVFLRSSATDPDRRPHHLLLTGDQVYGDNVAEALLYEIIQANATLFGVQEVIPGANVTADRLHPGLRGDVMRTHAGQPNAEDTYKRSHALTLTEYISLYLYAWSDVLWPAPGAWIDQLTARGGVGVGEVPAPHPVLEQLGLATDPVRDYDENLARLDHFRDALPAVRRALANVPTYMTFDDHDVTDSWSITYNFTRTVLDSAFGGRHMRNGITAYALCQGWGNRPDDFEPGQPGARLFDAVTPWIATGGADLESDVLLRSMIGPNEPHVLPDQTSVLTAPDPQSTLHWNFIVDFPSHRIISLDSRTRCGYPDTGEGFLAIIAPSLVGEQIPIVEEPPPLTFVISGAPVVGYGFLETCQRMVAQLFWPSLGNAEEWVYHVPAQQTLLAQLAHTGPRGSTVAGLPGRKSRVVMLSGDVHFGYTARLQYWAERPYGWPTPSAVDMVMAQLTCSAFKNERPATDSWHRDGMQAMFNGPSDEFFAPGPGYVSEAVGWANDGGTNVQVGTRQQTGGAPDVSLRISGANQVLYSSPQSSTPIRALTVPPDYAFRADWVVDPRFYSLDRPGEEPLERLVVDLQAIADDPSFAAEVAALEAEIEARRARIAGASIVGRNQIGEITVTWRNGEPVAVNHGIWWRELRVAEERAAGVDSELLPLTATTVSLEFDEVARPFR